MNKQANKTNKWERNKQEQTKKQTYEQKKQTNDHVIIRLHRKPSEMSLCTIFNGTLKLYFPVKGVSVFEIHEQVENPDLELKEDLH